jgi:endonuclease/exonuclease/phosphatase family metal-dependent hydrolase
MRLRPGLALVAAALSCGPRGGPAPVRIATWNVHNLFDDLKAAEETVATESGYQNRLAGVAAVLEELRADVVVLEEVENQRVLLDLSSRVPDLGYLAAALVPGNDPRGINVGALSRFPFDAVVSHRSDTFGRYGYHYARDCLELHLTVDDHHLVLLGVHFKSKAAPDDPAKRLAEAEHTRTIADALAREDGEAAISILGDFNDVPSSPAWRAVAGDEPEVYVDVAASIDRAFTYQLDGRSELLDHIMVDTKLARALDATSVAILHDAKERAASDHAPVAATFELR